MWIHVLSALILRMLTNTDTIPSLSQTSLSICSRFGNQKQQNCNQNKKNKITQQDRHTWKPTLQHWTQQKKMRKKQTKEKKLKTLEMNKSTKSTSVNTQRFSRYTPNSQSRQHIEDRALPNCLPRNSMHYRGMEWSAIYKLSPFNRKSTTCEMHYLRKEHQHLFRRS
jgi:uncharacterized membrane protein YqiK